MALNPAFGYLRVSGNSQTDGDGFPRQRQAIERYAGVHGYEITQWFQEKAVPGKTEWADRPAWVDMVSSMNGVRTIFIEKLDRLARDLMVQEHIIADLRRREVDLVSVTEPDLCVDDPSRKMMRQIFGAFAEYDRAMIVAKLGVARKRMKSKTGRCEGRKPYGFRNGEPEVIETMREWRARGMTFEAIAGEMNGRGIPTRSGGKWKVGTISNILAREARLNSALSSAKHYDKYLVSEGRICDEPATNFSGPCGVRARCDAHDPLLETRAGAKCD